MTEAPGERMTQQARGARLALCSEHGHGDQVVGIQCVAHAQQESHGQYGDHRILVMPAARSAPGAARRMMYCCILPTRVREWAEFDGGVHGAGMSATGRAWPWSGW